ncbi:hypothetical protein [Haloprofundus salilacus]|uniref:hypothetical protein n=1 Tax=Haloprofundus salilacus TaxID=2876190 RepID=UPI001CC9C912|nr:hypothetical protein [Haloprofundus salilacus]
MWGPKPVDGFTVVICWILGHEWPTESDESAVRAESAENSERVDAYRCQRCNKRKEEKTTRLAG